MNISPITTISRMRSVRVVEIKSLLSDFHVQGSQIHRTRAAGVGFGSKVSISPH